MNQRVTEIEVLDTKTGLVWRRDPEPGKYTFYEALARASQVAKETRQPWRVPTIDELTSLVDRSSREPGEPASNFPGMSGIRFRSSSQVVGDPFVAWVVNFINGDVDYYDNRDFAFAVRLVRNADEPSNLHSKAV